MTKLELIDEAVSGGRTQPGAPTCRAAGAPHRCGGAVSGRIETKVLRSALRFAAAAVLLLPFVAVPRGLAAELDRQGLAEMPMVWASLQVSRRADRIVTAAPGLLSVTSRSEQNRVRGAVQADISRLEADLQDLRRRGAGVSGEVVGQTAAMEQLVGQFSESLEVLDRTASARLVIGYLKAEQREAANAAQRAIAAALKPWAAETAAATAALHKALRDAVLDDRRRLKISNALIEALTLQRRIERALASSERADLALAVAACCAPQDRLSEIRPMIEAAVTDLEDLGPALADAGLPSLGRPTAVLRRVGLGPQNIVTLRQVELRMQTTAEAALARNAELAEAFSGRVDILVATARQTQSAAN